MATLSPLQRRVIELLTGMSPPWTLTGGGALVGYHLRHRTTMDLDLFWHGRRDLGEAPREVIRRLEAAGLVVARLQAAPSFVRLSASETDATVIVDLVAEPVPHVDPPSQQADGVWIDTPHEILVNKLTALVSRSELRDLEDVRALVGAGGDLDRALTDAPRKDGGFSPLVLAWTLHSAPLEQAATLGFDEAALRAFRDDLLERIARPPE